MNRLQPDVEIEFGAARDRRRAPRPSCSGAATVSWCSRISPGRLTRSRTFRRNGECLMATIDDSTRRRMGVRRTPLRARSNSERGTSTAPHAIAVRGIGGERRASPCASVADQAGAHRRSRAPAGPYRSRSTASRRREQRRARRRRRANAARSAIRDANARGVSTIAAADPEVACASRSSSSHAASAGSFAPRDAATTVAALARAAARPAASSRSAATSSAITPPRSHHAVAATATRRPDAARARGRGRARGGRSRPASRPAPARRHRARRRRRRRAASSREPMPRPGRRLERHPADALEVEFGPRVQVVRVDLDALHAVDALVRWASPACSRSRCAPGCRPRARAPPSSTRSARSSPAFVSRNCAMTSKPPPS